MTEKECLFESQTPIVKNRAEDAFLLIFFTNVSLIQMKHFY